AKSRDLGFALIRPSSFIIRHSSVDYRRYRSDRQSAQNLVILIFLADVCGLFEHRCGRFHLAPLVPKTSSRFTTFDHFSPHPTPKPFPVNKNLQGQLVDGCGKVTSAKLGSEKRDESRLRIAEPLGIAFIEESPLDSAES